MLGECVRRLSHSSGFAAGIYATNNAEVCAFIANDCKAQVVYVYIKTNIYQIVIVEDNEQLQKFYSMRAHLPHMLKIVQYKGTPSVRDANVLTWAEFMAHGASTPHIDVVLERRMATQRVNECCTLIYTSGTTGAPKVLTFQPLYHITYRSHTLLTSHVPPYTHFHLKRQPLPGIFIRAYCQGVMLSHDNITWTALASKIAFRQGWANDHLVSFLPLSHVVAQV